jgi:hypothetical protein
MRYLVKCGYRTATGFPSMTDYPTHFDTVEVEADDVPAARTEAIDVMYSKHTNIEHVKPMTVKEA